MEGYLLVLTGKRAARLRFCVLEDGLIKCLERPGGPLLESVALTRHQIRVRPLAADDGGDAGACPNRFAVHALAVSRSERANAFVAAAPRPATHVFAAAHVRTMTRWVNAIHNWRRHSFEASAAVQTSGREKWELLDVLSRFDMKLEGVATAARVNAKMRREEAQTQTQTRHSAYSLRSLRASARVASWLPMPRLSFSKLGVS